MKRMLCAGKSIPTQAHDPLRELAVIGDQRTAALLDRKGNIVWCCPSRFDRPSLFASLLDPNGGAWSFGHPDVEPAGRRYLGESSVTDFMPVGPMRRGMAPHGQGGLTTAFAEDWRNYVSAVCRRRTAF